MIGNIRNPFVGKGKVAAGMDLQPAYHRILSDIGRFRRHGGQLINGILDAVDFGRGVVIPAIAVINPDHGSGICFGFFLF